MMAEKFIRLKLGEGQIDLPATFDELRGALLAAGFSGQAMELPLLELNCTALNDQGAQLLAEMSEYEPLATANLACTLLAVPELNATAREVVDSARRLMPQQKESLDFYCPLTLRTEDGDGNLVEDDPDLLVYHEDEICCALKESVPEGDNMARHMTRCSQPLREKTASAVWDIGKIDGQVYGIIRCEFYAPLTAEERQELAEWIAAQNHDGIGEGLEQMTIETPDGALYVSFGSSDPGYFVLPENEFRAQVLGDANVGFGAHSHLVGMFDSGDEIIENTPKAVAEFICRAGQYGDVIVATPDYERVLNTFGIYVDRCTDQAFLQRLLPHLVPMQHEVENNLGLECDCEAAEAEQSLDTQGFGGMEGMC